MSKVFYITDVAAGEFRKGDMLGRPDQEGLVNIIDDERGPTLCEYQYVVGASDVALKGLLAFRERAKERKLKHLQDFRETVQRARLGKL